MVYKGRLFTSQFTCRVVRKALSGATVRPPQYLRAAPALGSHPPPPPCPERPAMVVVLMLVAVAGGWRTGVH